MNYTFGQDLTRTYSFRPTTTMGGALAPQQAMAGLQSSLAYRQAGIQGKQRMERLVGMGLPAQTDINKARIERVGVGGFEYSAPRVAYGTWSGFGGKQEEEPVPTGIRQPESLTKATEIQKTKLGESGQPLAFTGFGQMARNQKTDQYQTPIGSGLSNLARIQTEKFGETSLKFPFAGAESAFERGARTTKIGDMPMFPSSRFGGPQPAERVGPIETQPRRSWMY